MKQILSTSLSLVQTSKVWVMANDYVGLEAVINDVSMHDDLVFAAIISLDGKIVAHTDYSYIGKYIADTKRIEYLQERQSGLNDSDSIHILLENDKYIEIIRSIREADKDIGYANIRLDQSIRTGAIEKTIIKGIVFTQSA